MMTWDEIEAQNPPSKTQRRSLLQVLKNIGATSSEILNYAIEKIEDEDTPHVVHLSQIPCILNTGNKSFSLSSWNKDETVRFYFKTVILNRSADGSQQLSFYTNDNVINDSSFIAKATQIFAIVQLHGVRESLYPKYIECITPSGLLDKNIGILGPWSHTAPMITDRPVPLTAKLYENEVSIRVKKQVGYALKKFLSSYSLAQLEEIDTNQYLYGSYTMTYPGRISGGGMPMPLISSLRKLVPDFSKNELDYDKYLECENSFTGKDDRVVKQLLAMSRLVKEGEPELAVIGCVSAIEWYLNLKYSFLKRKLKNGKELSSSLTNILKDKNIPKIPEKMKLELFELASIRNSIVHGEPPKRNINDLSNGMENYAKTSISLVLKLYKMINESLNKYS